MLKAVLNVFALENWLKENDMQPGWFKNTPTEPVRLENEQ
jgi:hypothetical protein